MTHKILKETIEAENGMPSITVLEGVTEGMSYDGMIYENEVDDLIELIYTARGTCAKCKYYELGTCTVFDMEKKEGGYCDEFKCGH